MPKEPYFPKPVWLCSGGFGNPYLVFHGRKWAEAHILEMVLRHIAHGTGSGHVGGLYLEAHHVTPSACGGSFSTFSYSLETVTFDGVVQYAITKKSKLDPAINYPPWTGSVQLPQKEE